MNSQGQNNFLKTTLCTYNQRAKAKSFMAQESQVSSGLLLLLQWYMGLEDWLHDIRSQTMLCTRKGKHKIKHSLRGHTRLGSPMKLCPTLGSCPEVKEYTDTKKVRSTSAPGGLCCTWDCHREAQKSISLQHGTHFSCALTCVLKKMIQILHFLRINLPSVDYFLLQWITQGCSQK